jgi:hypothetical protein
MPASTRREFTLKALNRALDVSAKKVRETRFAKGLPLYVLEGDAIVRVAPDGTRRVLRKVPIAGLRTPAKASQR